MITRGRQKIFREATKELRFEEVYKFTSLTNTYSASRWKKIPGRLNKICWNMMSASSSMKWAYTIPCTVTLGMKKEMLNHKAVSGIHGNCIISILFNLWLISSVTCYIKFAIFSSWVFLYCIIYNIYNYVWLYYANIIYYIIHIII